MRFHLALQFLPLDEAVALGTAADRFGYQGVYMSDHLFNPKDLKSRYTYSEVPDGSPFWPKETEWPDTMCLISALAAVTATVTFTTGVYIAPVRDLITVAKTVGTAVALSHDRIRLGVGVGWCEEEYIQTGQDFHTRGKRLERHDPRIAGPLEGWMGRVPRHVLRRTALPDEPGADPARAHPVRWRFARRSPASHHRCATGGSTPGAAPADLAFTQVKTVMEALNQAGRNGDDFAIYMARRARTPTSTSIDGSRMPGSPICSVPHGWRFPATGRARVVGTRAAHRAVRQFAEQFIAKMA